jgi:hypothetical protein
MIVTSGPMIDNDGLFLGALAIFLKGILHKSASLKTSHLQSSRYEITEDSPREEKRMDSTTYLQKL